MKFILNEKYRLEERYILNEDDLAKPETTAEQGNTNNQAQAPSTAPTANHSNESGPISDEKQVKEFTNDIKQIVDSIDGKVLTIQNSIIKATEDAKKTVDALETALEDSRKKINAIKKNNPNYAELRQSIKQYISALKKYDYDHKSIISTLPELRGLYSTIQNFIKQDTPADPGRQVENTKTLLGQYNKFDSLIVKTIDANQNSIPKANLDALAANIKATTAATKKLKGTLADDSVVAALKYPDLLNNFIQVSQDQNNSTSTENTSLKGKFKQAAIQFINAAKFKDTAKPDKKEVVTVTKALSTITEQIILLNTQLGQLPVQAGAKAEAAKENEKGKAEAEQRGKNFDTATGTVAGDDTWTQRYNKAKAKAISQDKSERDPQAIAYFWNGNPSTGEKGYYASYWGANADTIKALGKTFIQEVDKIGFDANENPFVAYLKTILTKDIKPNKQIYDQIHNNYVDRYIDNRDLRGKIEDKNHAGENNIIFCADFYTKDKTEAAELLKLQNHVLRRSSLADLEPETVKAAYNKDDAGMSKYIKDLFYVGGDTVEVKDPPQQPYKLKSSREIARTLAVNGLSYDASADAKKAKEAFKLKGISQNLLTGDAYNITMSYLLNKFGGYNAATLAKDNHIEARQVSPENITKLSSVFNHYDINEDNISEILKELAIKAGQRQSDKAEQAATSTTTPAAK